MICLSTYESVNRLTHRFKNDYVYIFCGVLGSTTVVALWGLFLVVRSGLQAQYAIPICGMLLGNTTSAVSVSLGSTLTELKERSAKIEALLALGATRWEATSDLLSKSIRLGLTPTLTQMNLIGAF